MSSKNNNQKNHVLKLLNSGVRLDGRKTDEYRQIKIETGITPTAEGSAKVTIGDTVVIAGVKMAVEKPYPDTADQGNLMVNAELLPLSSPEFESGPPSIVAIELARVVDRGIRESKAIDTKKLCIKEGEKAWSVMIDICTINDNGNLLDASAMAAMAAIKDAKFPKYDVEKGIIDYKEKTNKSVPITKEPVSITILKVGNSLIVDPLPEEEKAMDARLTVAIVANHDIVAMQKGGEQDLTSTEIIEMVKLAITKADELRKHL